MSDQVLAEIIVPIVVAVILGIWIAMVMRANSRPRRGRSADPTGPGRDVAGGVFHGHGGRQLMPLPVEPDPDLASDPAAEPGPGDNERADRPTAAKRPA